jgi:hypothetical protein
VIKYDPKSDWIFHEQGVGLILDLYRVSEPHADIIVWRYRKSDEARYCDDGMIDIPRDLSGLPFSKAYFLDYLERTPPGRRRTKPKVKEARPASTAQIPGIVSKYLAGTTTPSEGGLVQYVKGNGLSISRARLRKEYGDQRPNRRPGRPSKNSPK